MSNIVSLAYCLYNKFLNGKAGAAAYDKEKALVWALLYDHENSSLLVVGCHLREADAD